MFKFLLIALFCFQAYGQDFTGVCQPKESLFERLAKDVDEIITTMARNSWSNVIELKSKDWPFAAFLLRYSLQDTPSPLIFPNSSRGSKLIQESSEYKTALEAIKKDLENSSDGTITGQSQLQFNSGDLAVALHNVSLDYQATRIDGKWKIDINITDIYDFAHHTKEEVESFKIRVINNMAYRDQEKGIITPYELAFELQETMNITKINFENRFKLYPESIR